MLARLPTSLNHATCLTLSLSLGPQVRQTALDYDGKILLAACDDGTIWRYDRDDRDGVSDEVSVQ